MCGPKFFSMKITQEVRDYAASLDASENEVIQIGLKEKAKEFKEGGSRLYSESV